MYNNIILDRLKEISTVGCIEGNKMNIKYRSDIDGLRAISIISILLFHLNAAWLPGGFVGVDIFFVISGYLITKIILKEGRGFSFIEFYCRRIKRIFPALFVMLLLTSLLAVISLPAVYYENYFKAFRYSAIQLSNFFFSRKIGYFDEGSELHPLLHTWSLGVEEQFYLVWPLIIFFFNRRKKASKALIIMFAISLALSLIYGLVNPNKAFYMFYTRAWEFCLGAAVIFIRPRRNVSVISLVGAALVICSMLIGGQSLFWHALLPCLGAAMLIYSGEFKSGIIYKLLSSRPLVFIGLISYSLYLWHWPVIVFYKHCIHQDISAEGYIFIVLTSFILAAFSYFLVEQKTRYINTSNKLTISLGATLVVIFCIFGQLMIGSKDSDWRIRNLRDKSEISRKEEVEKMFFNVHDEKEYDVLLIGDSHAEHYFPSIYKYYNERGLKARMISIKGCPPLLGEYNVIGLRPNNISRVANSECKGFQQEIVRALEEPRLKHVFIAMNQEKYTRPSSTGKSFLSQDGTLTDLESRLIWRKSLEATIKQLKGSGKDIYLLGQVPMLRTSPNACAEITMIDRLIYTKNEIDLKKQECFKIEFDYVEERLNYSVRIYKKLTKEYNLHYFEPIQYFKAIPNVSEIYNDRDHINLIGARYLYLPFESFIPPS